MPLMSGRALRQSSAWGVGSRQTQGALRSAQDRHDRAVRRLGEKLRVPRETGKVAQTGSGAAMGRVANMKHSDDYQAQ